MQRNEPCFCGSGKKYKKCHLKQVSMQSDGNVPKQKLTKDERIERAMREMGVAPAKVRSHQIQKEVSIPQGKQALGNTRAAQKIGGSE